MRSFSLVLFYIISSRNFRQRWLTSSFRLITKLPDTVYIIILCEQFEIQTEEVKQGKERGTNTDCSLFRGIFNMDNLNVDGKRCFLIPKDKLFSCGLSISYDRVLRLSAEMGNRACQMFQTEQVVCPPTLRVSVFTTAAVDNIDQQG